MNKKDLEKLGLTTDALKAAELPDDLVDQIIVLYGKSVTKLRSDIQTAETSVNSIQAQLDAANKQIGEFRTMDVDKIKQSAADWETKAKQAEADGKAAVDALRLQHRIESILKDEFHVLDPVDVLPHLKMDVVKLDGETVLGLKDQVEPIRKSKPYLFKATDDSDESEEESDEFEEGNPAPKITVTRSRKSNGNTGSFADAIRENLKIK